MKENINIIYSKVFFWMFFGFLITFITGYYVSLNENMLYNICSAGMQIFLYIAEIVTVIILTSRINKMSEMTAKVLFCLYAFITGLTFSVLFYAYEIGSIMYVFGISSILFLIFGFIGKTTNKDLSKLGSIVLMIILGLLIVSIINIFIGSTLVELLLSCIFIIAFLIITAVDMQKVKTLSQVFNEDKASILGALELYLDFINIFIELLRLFGKNKD